MAKRTAQVPIHSYAAEVAERKLLRAIGLDTEAASVKPELWRRILAAAELDWLAPLVCLRMTTQCPCRFLVIY
jgi:hypothetical protein